MAVNRYNDPAQRFLRGRSPGTLSQNDQKVYAGLLYMVIERNRAGTNIPFSEAVKSMPGGILDPVRLDAERRKSQQNADFQADKAAREGALEAARQAATARSLLAQRQMSRNDRIKAAADAAAAETAAAAQQAAANSLPNLIANAVATKKCDQPQLINMFIYQSAECQSYRAAQNEEYKARVISVNKAADDAAAKKLAGAVANQQAARAAVRAPAPKPRPQPPAPRRQPPPPRARR